MLEPNGIQVLTVRVNDNNILPYKFTNLNAACFYSSDVLKLAPVAPDGATAGNEPLAKKTRSSCSHQKVLTQQTKDMS